MIDQLAGLLGDVCGAPASTLKAESSPANTPGWDSVAMLTFIVAVEDSFGVTIATTEALGLKTLGDMARLVERKKG